MASGLPGASYPVSIHASCFQKAMHAKALYAGSDALVSIHASCFQKAMPRPY